MRLTWLLDVLHAVNVPVIELDGWRGRGHELSTVNGIVLHDTVTPATTPDANVAKLLRDGRADLAGPLTQLGLDRQGRFWLIADGRCNHNGYGMWGNQAIGIEAFNGGTGEPWPLIQLDNWQRGTAAILAHIHLNEGHALGHRETDPRRKVDPVGVDLDAFRHRVHALLTSQEDDMYSDTDRARDEKVAKQVQEIHDAVYKGHPEFGQAGIEGAVAEIHKKVGA